MLVSETNKLFMASFKIDHINPDEIGKRPTPTSKIVSSSTAPASDIRSKTVIGGALFDTVESRPDIASVDDAVSLLDSGADIADIPDEHLAAALITAADDPDRPRFTSLGRSDTATGVIIIRDNLSGITYGVKGRTGVLHPNEAAAEIIGPHVAELLGFEMGAVRLGSTERSASPNTSFAPYDTIPIVVQFADSMFENWSARSDGDPYDTTASKRSLAGMMLLDLIISHRDRNSKNFGVADGTYFPFDYGGSIGLIEGPDRAFFNGAYRGDPADFFNQKLTQAASRLSSPAFVYPTLIGGRDDLTAEELADEVMSLLDDLRTKDLSQLRELAARLSDMQLQEFRGTQFDRPVTSQPAIQKSYEFPADMIEHISNMDPEEFRSIIINIFNSIAEKRKASE